MATKTIEHLKEAHADEAARHGVQLPSDAEVSEEEDVVRIISKPSSPKGLLVSSLDRKTGEIEHNWHESDLEDDYDGPVPDFDRPRD
jgi:hypothetical protein